MFFKYGFVICFIILDALMSLLRAERWNINFVNKIHIMNELLQSKFSKENKIAHLCN